MTTENAFDPQPGDAGSPVAELHRGQLRMAGRLARSHADKLMFVHGIGWHAWHGDRWVEDQHGAATRAVIEVLVQAIADSFHVGDTHRKELRADVQRCESDAGIGGVLGIAKALPPFAQTVADLDPDPFLLNVANGTVDLRTLQVHAHDPADRITKITHAAYHPEQQGALWATFLDRVLPDPEVRGFLQRYVGLALLGQVLDHRLAILTGPGRNGKGVFYLAVNHALGDYADVADPELFMHRDGAAHPTGVMDLRGRRWVVVSETERDRRLAEVTVKRLTGGDTIKARRMRQDFVTFTPSHTAALITNHLPTVRGDDLALWARLRVVPFDVVIPEQERDPELSTKLELDADAVLSWAVAGWVDYRERGLAEPEAVLTATTSYRIESDAVARFLDDCCLLSPHMYVKTGDLWATWSQWRAEDGAPEVTRKAFGQELARRGLQTARRNIGRIWVGLSLQAGADHDA